MVTIIVGADNTAFYVHKALLTQESTFFRAAFTGGFQEAITNTMNMPDDLPEVFEDFLKWLYACNSSSIMVEAGDKVPKAGIHHEPLRKSAELYSRLLKLYILADKIGTSTLATNILKRFATSPTIDETDHRKVQYELPNCNDITHVYSRSLPKSEIRKIVAKDAAFRLSLSSPEVSIFEMAIHDEPEFAMDLLQYLAAAHFIPCSLTEYYEKSSSIQRLFVVEDLQGANNLVRSREFQRYFCRFTGSSFNSGRTYRLDTIMSIVNAYINGEAGNELEAFDKDDVIVALNALEKEGKIQIMNAAYNVRVL
jgi:BTB/POZ domain